MMNGQRREKRRTANSAPGGLDRTRTGTGHGHSCTTRRGGELRHRHLFGGYMYECVCVRADIIAPYVG